MDTTPTTRNELNCTTESTDFDKVITTSIIKGGLALYVFDLFFREAALRVVKRALNGFDKFLDGLGKKG